MNQIMNIVKKIVISLCLLYAFNLLTSKIGYYIPINFITVSLISLLDFNGLMILIVLSTF